MSVRVPAERAEEARAVMIELFPGGFEEVEADGDVELAAYTNAGGEERLWQFLGPGAARDVTGDWEEGWKRFHRPIRVGPLWVGPPWLAPDADAVAVVIDPGRAFGTGAHPTTRLCLELLLDLPRTSLLDVGCGSGVIAIAAAKLGFGPVSAVDVEEEAIEATRENAVANGVRVDVARRDLHEDRLPEADVATANIALAAVEAVAPRLEAKTLVSSGYLSHQRPRVHGWTPTDRRERDGWAADVFARAD